MKYIGNYREWINKEWIDYMLAGQGHSHIRNNPAEYGKDNHISKLLNSGWDISKELWSSYEQDILPFVIDKMPIDIGPKYQWWFVKLLPGQVIPIHKDHKVKNWDELDCKRFWMPLQDYEKGHFFFYNDSTILDYKAGDVFAYTDQDVLHGALNTNERKIRLTFNFTFYGVF